jgi:2'-5' RNA ligase
MRSSLATAMTDYRDHHATVFLPPEIASSIEAVRQEWDPDMATQIPAHVTLIYPNEAPRLDLLISRIGASCSTASPFRLRLGPMTCFERPERGVYVEVADIDGGYSALREEVLRPPFQGTAFPPHATLVHPRTSNRGRELWQCERYQWSNQEFTAREVSITAFGGARWVVLMTFTLGRQE